MTSHDHIFQVVERKVFIFRKYEKYYFKIGFKRRSLNSQAGKTHLSGIDAEARKVTYSVNKSLISLLLLHTCILLACMTINKIQLTFPFHLFIYWLQPRAKILWERQALHSFSKLRAETIVVFAGLDLWGIYTRRTWDFWVFSSAYSIFFVFVFTK